MAQLFKRDEKIGSRKNGSLKSGLLLMKSGFCTAIFSRAYLLLAFDKLSSDRGTAHSKFSVSVHCMFLEFFNKILCVVHSQPLVNSSC